MRIEEKDGKYCLITEAHGAEGYVRGRYDSLQDAELELAKIAVFHEKYLAKIGLTDEQWRAKRQAVFDAVKKRKEANISREAKSNQL